MTTYLTEDEFALRAGLEAALLTKKRYKVDGVSIEQFEGALAGLELVEIEWPDDRGLREIVAPKWATGDVSDDIRYQGGSLAINGL